MTTDLLIELALRAVVTPSLDAPVAFAVLVDALLEAGEIKAPDRLRIMMYDGKEATDIDDTITIAINGRPAFVRPSLLHVAWKWAKAETDVVNETERTLVFDSTSPSPHGIEASEAVKRLGRAYRVDCRLQYFASGYVGRRRAGDAHVALQGVMTNANGQRFVQDLRRLLDVERVSIEALE